MQIGDLQVKVSASISDFNEKMASVKSSLKNVQGSAVTVGKAGAKALGLISGALAVIKGAVGIVGVQYDAMQEQSKIAWGTILGDQNEAIKTLDTLKKMGADTPFEFEGLDKSAKLLQMAGFHGKDLFKTLTDVGDAVSAIGGNDDVLQGVSMAIFQMASKGKVSAEEMNQLAERGIPAWKLISDQMHIPVQQLMQMSQNGKLYAKDVLPLLTKGMRDTFGGSMQKQSQTFNGMLSTIKDNTVQLAGVLAQPLFDKLKSGMQAVIPLLNGLMDLAQGNLKGFKDSLEKVFGADTTAKIMSFFGVVAGLFDKFKGGFTTVFNVVKTYIPPIISTIGGFINGVINYFKQLFSGKNNVGSSFISIFNTIKSIAVPILKDAVAFIKSILAGLSAFWKENGATIIQAVKNFWHIIASIFKFLAPVIKFIVEDLWGSIKGVIKGAIKIIEGIIQVFAGLFTGNFKEMWQGVKNIFGGAVQFIWNLINLLFLGKLIKGFKSLFSGAIAIFKNLWKGIVDIFKGIGDGLATSWEWIKNTAIKATQWIYDHTVGVWERMWNKAMDIFGKIGHAIAHPIETAKNLIKNHLGTIMSLFNAFHIHFPHINLPHLSITWKHTKIGHIPYPSFNLKWYASGGIVNGAQMIGVGERGPEAVIPLQGARMKPFADAIARQIMPNRGQGSITNNFNIASVVIREEADIKKVARELHGLQTREQRKGGR